MKIFGKSLFYDSTPILSTFTSVRSSTRFPAVTRLTVHRRRQSGSTSPPAVRKVDGLPPAP
eukprot:5937473-Pyramimonas_sp.AAC.1